ncbi:uncharacterized protein FIBRA_00922 [Fibroporia radiculosa]|uniref:Cytochrome P450 n=1 Tax=Fibroporia radiculosa TaxID=599839 RepID=J4GIY4_9APHY|nr:uncharacterized protein FIBRA_00922 [Fibroporia radiculosa]CCL98915.1 predicted protein [Fibroporia radiculosa]
MASSAEVICALLAIVVGFVVIRKKTDPLHHIPAIGPTAPLLSYLGAIRFLNNAREVLQEGYDKYKIFKVSMFDRWIVVVSGAKMNEELRKVPDEQMSFMEAIDLMIQSKYTIAPDILVHPIHITVIKEQLTKNLAPLFPDVAEEVRLAFQELIPAKDDEWVSVPGYDTIAAVIARASNRVFVGVPLCRNAEYLKLATTFTAEVMKGCTVLAFFPDFLKPLIGPFLPWSRRAIRRMHPLLRPVIEERLRQREENGDDWSDKPNDLLMWIIDEARRVGLNEPIDLWVQGVLVSNFTAIHTSTITFTHALFHLAANPEYIKPLREEVEEVIRQENGWTKVSMNKMWKLDSFLKESSRVNGVSGIAVTRIALTDVTLSDGTLLPMGTVVTAAAASTHLDEENYDKPDIFDPFRFSNMRAEESEKNRHHYVSTSAEYIGFGHGRHACPGRFFAVNELKIMLATIILYYDVKFADGGKRPDNTWMATTILPNQTAKVMFRKRQDLVV